MASRLQESTWFQHWSSESSDCNVARSYRVSGKLDLQALRSAWRSLVERHESLRTALIYQDAGLVQRIRERAAAEIVFTDLGALRAETRAARSRDLLQRWARAPIDPAESPAARLVVVRLDDREHEVMLVVHQSVVDAGSAAILIADLGTLYSAAAPHLHDLPQQYADYAEWQRDRERLPAFQRSREWWVRMLRPVPRPVELPVNRSAAHSGSHSAASNFSWGPRLGQVVADLAEREGTTTPVVVLAALQALLHRYDRQDRLVAGFAVSTRPRSGFEGVAGAFLNPMPVCGDFTHHPSFREHVRNVARYITDAAEHACVAFNQVLSALDIPRNAHRPVLHNVAVIDQTAETTPALPGASARPSLKINGLAGADLVLAVDSTRPLGGFVEWSADRLDEASVLAMLDQLNVLLEAAVDDPDRRTDELPLEPPGTERAAERPTSAPTAVPVHEQVRRHASRAPSAPAVHWDGDVTTYRQLLDDAARIATAIREHGASPDSPVAVRIPPGPRQVSAVLGVLSAGSHLLCLPTDDRGQQARAALADSGAPLLLVAGSSQRSDLIEWFSGRRNNRVCDVTQLASLHRAEDEPRAVDGGDLAYVAYTSGSTGAPKGISQSHAALSQFATWFSEEFGIGPGSRVAQWAAPGYDASLCEIFATLTAGATLHPVPERIRANPGKLLDWLAAREITHFQTVPSFARELLRSLPDHDARNLPTLGHLLLAGEALPADVSNGLCAALPHTRLVNLYGPTETILATWQPITEVLRGPAPIGRAIPGREVLVVNEHDRPCPAGVPGQIVILSPYVTPGYTGSARSGRTAFRPLRGEPGTAGWRCFRTGDRGRRRWDGALEFHGRRDGQIKFHGVRLELTEIESVLAAHDSVAACAVVPTTDHQGLVTKLTAHVVPRPGAHGDPKTWRAHLRRWFGTSRLAISFTVAAALPRNAGGKVDRRELRAAATPETESRATETEAALAELWSAVLDVDEIAADDDFFALGGHLLLMPAVQQRIRDLFGVDLAPRDLLIHTSPADLAQAIAAASANPTPIADRQPRGEKS